MIVCVSANPAIDKRVRLPKLALGRVNRVSHVHAAAGGKAAHVAMALRALGSVSRWIGFAGGATGQELLAGLKDLGISSVIVPMNNATRVNLEIIDEDGSVTEILEPGPVISTQECRAFESACESVFREAGHDLLAVFSGSLPPGLPSEFYANLIALTHRFGGQAFLDTSGEPLKRALSAGPDFVKPNREEAEWLGSFISDAKSAAAAIAKLIAAGAKSAAISLGPAGLVWQPAKSRSVFHALPAKVAARSGVGSGDATVAGFAYAAREGLGPKDSLKLAAACGAANCLADLPGQLHASDVHRLRELVKIEVLA
jgi:1-phosphofructokinase family hexose kinase